MPAFVRRDSTEARCEEARGIQAHAIFNRHIALLLHTHSSYLSLVMHASASRGASCSPVRLTPVFSFTQGRHSRAPDLAFRFRLRLRTSNQSKSPNAGASNGVRQGESSAPGRQA